MDRQHLLTIWRYSDGTPATEHNHTCPCGDISDMHVAEDLRLYANKIFDRNPNVEAIEFCAYPKTANIVLTTICRTDEVNPPTHRVTMHVEGTYIVDLNADATPDLEKAAQESFLLETDALPDALDIGCSLERIDRIG